MEASLNAFSQHLHFVCFFSSRWRRTLRRAHATRALANSHTPPPTTPTHRSIPTSELALPLMLAGIILPLVAVNMLKRLLGVLRPGRAATRKRTTSGERPSSKRPSLNERRDSALNRTSSIEEIERRREVPPIPHHRRSQQLCGWPLSPSLDPLSAPSSCARHELNHGVTNAQPCAPAAVSIGAGVRGSARRDAHRSGQPCIRGHH